MSEPFEPKPNIYTCDTCGKQTVTVDVAEGATPFVLDCRATQDCPGRGWSQCYQVPPSTVHRATHEWYRPEGADYRALSLEMRKHVDKGGLVMRPVFPALD